MLLVLVLVAAILAVWTVAAWAVIDYPGYWPRHAGDRMPSRQTRRYTGYHRAR